MDFKEYFSLVANYLVSKKTRSYLTLIGIFIGIAAVVSLIGLGEGLRSAITGQFGFLGTNVLTVQAAGVSNRGAPGTFVARPLTTDLNEKIERVSNVETVINRHLRIATLEYNGEQQYSYVMSSAMGVKRKAAETAMNIKIIEGRLLKDSDTKKIVVGYNYKEDERFGKAMGVGDTMLINQEPFEVVGIIERKGSFIIDNSVSMNEDYYLEFLGDDGTVNVITVQVKDTDLIQQTEEDIEKLLRKERGVKKGEEDFTVETPQKSIESLNSTLLAVQIFVYIIAGISIVVGGIGITNTMYTSVLERTSDIGIMKSIGARNSVIFKIFALESGMFGLLGGSIGVILGMILAFGLSAIGRLALGSDLIKATIGLPLILGALAFSFIVGIIAGIMPAYRASRMQPVEAVRYGR